MITAIAIAIGIIIGAILGYLYRDRGLNISDKNRTYYFGYPALHEHAGIHRHTFNTAPGGFTAVACTKEEALELLGEKND
jgi:hypothetical protein